MTELCVIPKPLECCAGQGRFSFAHDVEIVADQDDDASQALAELMCSEMTEAASGTVSLVSEDQPGSQACRIRLRIEPQATPPGREGYELTVEPAGISLRAHEAAGLFHGWKTLRLMLHDAKDNAGGKSPFSLACCRIVDRPRFSWRGFMLDSSRVFQPVERVKRVIDVMACLKLNVFHWHLTDDQVWTIESKKYPRLNGATWWRRGGQGRSSYYGRDEIREIVAYAKQRFITVVPEIEMPGHCNCVLTEYPELSCAGKPVEGVFGAKGDTPAEVAERLPYCIGKSETIEFLKGILADTAELFDAPFIHIGGDERPRGQWENCPHCNALLKKLRLRDEDQLQNWFMDQMAQFVHDELGRKTVAWAENLKDGCPRGQIVQGWRGTEVEDALALGAEVVNSLNNYTYFDYPQTDQEQEIFCEWMCLLTLAKVYEFDPVPAGTPTEKASLVLGTEGALWTSFVPDEVTLYHQMMPRLVALAEVAWSSRENRDFADFRTRLEALQERLEMMGLWPNVTKPDFTGIFPSR